MDRELDANIHLVGSESPKDTILKVYNILISQGISLGDSSTLLLYDPEMECDFDIEPASNIDNVIKRLVSWPLLGVVSLEYGNYFVDVSFRKYKNNNSIDCVSLSFPEELYRSDCFYMIIKSLLIKLHEELNAVRSIADIALESDSSGYNIDNEIILLAGKKIQGEYWLDIIDKTYFTEDLESLKQRCSIEVLKEDIFLERKKSE
jgi:hypothetical protein